MSTHNRILVGLLSASILSGTVHLLLYWLLPTAGFLAAEAALILVAGICARHMLRDLHATA